MDGWIDCTDLDVSFMTIQLHISKNDQTISYWLMHGFINVSSAFSTLENVLNRYQGIFSYINRLLLVHIVCRCRCIMWCFFFWQLLKCPCETSPTGKQEFGSQMQVMERVKKSKCVWANVKVQVKCKHSFWEGKRERQYGSERCGIFPFHPGRGMLILLKSKAT